MSSPPLPRGVAAGAGVAIVAISWLMSYGPGAYQMSVGVSALVASVCLLIAWTGLRHPVAALVGTVVMIGLLPMVDSTFEAVVPVMVVVGFQVALQGRVHPALLFVVVFGALTFHDVWVRIALDKARFDPSSLNPLLFATLTVGLGVQSRRIAASIDRLKVLDEAERSRIVSDERRRIARDVHDVAAHHLSALVVHNQLAQRIGTTEALQGASEFTSMTSADALDALRQVVRVLDVDRSVPLTPSPSLADLYGIVERMRIAGLAVEVERTLPRSLPHEVEIAATRIVQEAFANILKHRGPGRAWLTLHDHGDSLVVRVEDDGDVCGQGTDAAARLAVPRMSAGAELGGAGLIGMQERAECCGGELQIGPSPRGGWSVQASLPVTTSPGRP